MIAFLEAKRAGLLSRQHWMTNLLAGVIVGVVALPLAMAFAIASGAKPEQGLYTAIVAGLMTSLFGGSRVQISGPTGAFIVILAGITAKYGIGGLQIATLMAGFMLLAMGFARLGNVIRFIPDPVITGFTAGIAVIIFVGQWSDFFALHPVTSANAHFHEKLWHLLLSLPQLNVPTTLLGTFTLAVLLLSPRLLRRVPAPLVAMVAATVLQSVWNSPQVATLGSTFGGLPQQLPSFSLPSMQFDDALRLIGPAFTIALLGAIESLLSAVVADSMAGTRHDSNQELVGQGLANIVSPLFGGFAATGAIARTATNIRNGGNSPLAGLVHSVTLILIVLLLAPLASQIPLAALAAILFVVAYNMSEWRHFCHTLLTAPRADVVVMLLTFFLTVFADLVIAVNIGVLLAVLLFMKRMAETVVLEQQTEAALKSELADQDMEWPAGTVVYSMEGPYFFGVAERIETTLERLQSHTKTLVLRMHAVPIIDATGLRSLAGLLKTCDKNGTRLILCGMRDNVAEKVKNAGLIDQVGSHCVIAVNTLAEVARQA